MKKGINLISLLVTIAVLTIISTIAIIGTTNIISDTKKKSFAEEIFSITKLVSDYYFRNEEYPLKTKISINFAELDSFGKEQFKDEKLENNNIMLNEINLSEAGVQSVSRGIKNNNDATDIYAFSIFTKKVYYIKGISINKKKYYTLTSELYDTLGIAEIK